jgi:hypothetical protein
MLPVMTKHDSPNGGSGYSKKGSQIQPGNSVFGVKGSDDPNIPFCKLGCIDLFANCLALSSLGSHVSGVIELGSKEEVRGTKTSRDIAFMQDAQSIGNSPNGQLVGQSMNWSAFTVHFCRSVSKGNFGSWPQHARVILGNVAQQFMKQRDVAILVGHLGGLLRRTCTALAALARCGAFSILPSNDIGKERFA